MTDVSKTIYGYQKKEYIFVHMLVILFGISAWIGINGIFIQLPVLINVSPEGWNLPAYLVLVIQSANIGPLLYTLLQHYQCKLNESRWIMCLLTLGTSSMGFLMFFYSQRTVIGGVEHSLVLFMLIFFNALVGCFSSVLFMPYLRDFNVIYLVSYFIGEGLSGVLPSIVALIQGVGDDSQCTITSNNVTNTADNDMKFSTRNYFLFIFIVLLLSLISFITLQYSSFVLSMKSHHETEDKVSNGMQTKYKREYEVSTISDTVCTHVPNTEISRFKEDEYPSKIMSNYLFLLLAICCFFSNGFFPSIQSYSCLPYGNTAYKLSITFAQFANPLACFLALWLIVTNVTVINYLSIACLALGSYVTYLALMSPAPPLQETTLGVVLVVLSWTVLIGFISYLKLIIVAVFRNTKAPKILFNAGVVMQLGSATGAILSFLTINFTNLFNVYDKCALDNKYYNI